MLDKTSRQTRKFTLIWVAAGAEEAAQCGNMKDLYNITGKLSGRFGRPERPVQDSEVSLERKDKEKGGVIILKNY
mgnify:CR=1 FL=1